jgi:hypothetical protein
MVRQGIWALLFTHYAIRHLMHEAADDAGIDPDRVSFMRSLRVIRRQVTDQAGFPPQTLTISIQTAWTEIAEPLNPARRTSDMPSRGQATPAEEPPSQTRHRHPHTS